MLEYRECVHEVMAATKTLHEGSAVILSANGVPGVVPADGLNASSEEADYFVG